MNTSNLNRTAPLAVVPSLPTLLVRVSEPLYRAKTFLMSAFSAKESTFFASSGASYTLPYTPLRFSGKSIYTPSQDWYGDR